MANFKITRLENNHILVEGLEKEAGWYLSENDEINLYGAKKLSLSGFKYSDTVTINYLHSLDEKSRAECIDYSINKHKNLSLDDIENKVYNEDLVELKDSNTFEIPFDGLFKVSHVIIPTNEWKEYLINNPDSAFKNIDIYYYDLNLKEIKHVRIGEIIDGKYEQSMITTLSLKELYEVDSTTNPGIVDSTKKESPPLYPFLMDHLKHCFYQHSINLLNLVRENSNCPTPEILNMERDRDLLWMFINAINYNLDFGRTLEAQRLLTELNKCNTLCSNHKPAKKYNYCGC